MKEKVGICAIAIVLTYVVWFVVLAMQPSKVERFNYSRRVIEKAFPNNLVITNQIRYVPLSEPIIVGPFREYGRYAKTSEPSFPSILLYGPYVYGKDDKIIWDSFPFKKVKPKTESRLDSLAKEQNISDEDILNWANPKK